MNYRINEQEMMIFLKENGFNPLKAKLLYKDDGTSKGCGFVQMNSDEEAASAVKKLNNFNFEGRSISIRMASNQA